MGDKLTEKPRRLSDRLNDPAFLDDLGGLPTEQLRQLRAELEEMEAEISYSRRLLQGKVDIVRHEVERRASGGDSSLQTLIENLPEILGEGASGSVGRHVRILIPRNAKQQRRDAERVASEATLAHIQELSADQLAAILTRLKDAEIEASVERRRVLDASDQVRGELVRRYREGQEDPSHLLQR